MAPPGKAQKLSPPKRLSRSRSACRMMAQARPRVMSVSGMTGLSGGWGGRSITAGRAASGPLPALRRPVPAPYSAGRLCTATGLPDMDKLPGRLDELRGKYADELTVGMSAIFSKTVTDADIVLFAGVTGDTNPVHLDEEFAKPTMF